MSSGEPTEADNFALRTSAAFFEKIEGYDRQELLAYQSSHWMLSLEDFKNPTDPPMGIISQMQNIQVKY